MPSLHLSLDWEMYKQLMEAAELNGSKPQEIIRKTLFNYARMKTKITEISDNYVIISKENASQLDINSYEICFTANGGVYKRKFDHSTTTPTGAD